MANKVFITSDLHFGHKNIIDIDSRPFETVEEMYKTISDNWNSIVSKEDTVIIAGDFCFKGRDLWKKALDGLNGKKILVLGNHDNPKKIPEECFEKITHLLKYEYKKVHFEICHYPIIRWDRKHYGAIHCYGHVHRTILKEMPVNSFNVGIMVNNYFPVNLDTLLKKRIIEKEKVI